MVKRHLVVAVAALAVCGALLWAGGAWSSGGPIENLSSPDGQVRQAAIDQLVHGGPGLLDMLLTELELGDHPAVARWGIGEAMRRIGVGNAEAARLNALLVSSNTEKRSAAAHALGSNGALARERLVALARSPREKAPIRAAAARALGTAGSAARGSLKAMARDLGLPQDLRHAAIDALALCAAAAASDVVDIATDGTRPAEDRQRALFALAQPSSPAGANALRALLSSGACPTAVRHHAVTALSSLGQASDATLVGSQLLDGSADVRLAALGALSRLAAEGQYLPEIAQLMADTDKRVQTGAIETIGRVSPSLGKDVKTALLSLLGDSNFRVRYEAALALYLHRDRSGGPVMQKDSFSTNASQASLAARLYTLIITLR